MTKRQLGKKRTKAKWRSDLFSQNANLIHGNTNDGVCIDSEY